MLECITERITVKMIPTEIIIKITIIIMKREYLAAAVAVVGEGTTELLAPALRVLLGLLGMGPGCHKHNFYGEDGEASTKLLLLSICGVRNWGTLCGKN